MSKLKSFLNSNKPIAIILVTFILLGIIFINSILEVAKLSNQTASVTSINCTDNCGESSGSGDNDNNYPYNSSGSGIDAGSGSGSGSGDYSYVLSIVKKIGYGTVISSTQPGINCSTPSSTCSSSYQRGANVTLIAQPVAGHYFAGWSGDQVSTSTKITVKMDSNKKISAKFAIKNKCGVIGYGGIHSITPNDTRITFTQNMKKVVEAFENKNHIKLFIKPIFRDGIDKASESQAQAIIDIKSLRDQKATKIFAGFHSLSSIGAFNAGIKSNGTDLRVVLYDPPYNMTVVNLTPALYLGNTVFLAWGNPAYIKLATKNGIAKSPDTVNLTNGTTLPEDTHSYDFKVINQILNDWLNKNCL